MSDDVLLGGFGEYLASIDWVAAIVAGVLLTAIGTVLYRFVAASTTEIGSMLPGAGRVTAEAILDARTGLPVDSWVCPACRSINTPSASRCYHGCGQRPIAVDGAVGNELPDDRTLLAAGHNGRRN